MCHEYHPTASPEIVRRHCLPDKRKFEHSNKVANRAVDQSHEYHPTARPELSAATSRREFNELLAVFFFQV